MKEHDPPADTEIVPTTRSDVEQELRAQRPSHRRGGLLLARLAVLVFILVAWQVVSGRWLPDYMISDPTTVAERLVDWTQSGYLWSNLLATLQATLYGFAAGATAGIVVGISMGLYRVFANVTEPFLIALYALPKIALTPLFILWFGIGLSMKVALVAVIVFFLVLWNAFAGVRAVERELVDIVQVMGANRRQILRKVVIPSALEWIFLGLKVAVPYAVVGAVTGEILASNRGMGFIVRAAAGQFDPAGVFAGLVVLMILATILNALLIQSERIAVPWRKTAERARTGTAL